MQLIKCCKDADIVINESTKKLKKAFCSYWAKRKEAYLLHMKPDTKNYIYKHLNGQNYITQKQTLLFNNICLVR